MARLPLVPDSEEDGLLGEIFERIHERGLEVPNLYRTIANAPRMLQAWMDLTWPLRHEGSSPRGLRELVIMRVTQVAGAAYPWAHHWPMAVAAGVSSEQLEALANWNASGLFDEKESATLAYVDEVVGDTGVRDATFAEMKRRFSDGDIVELTLAATFYLNLAHFARALQIDLEPEYEQYARRLPA